MEGLLLDAMLCEVCRRSDGTFNVYNISPDLTGFESEPHLLNHIRDWYDSMIGGPEQRYD